jgi:hypothetical protein
MVNEMNIKKTGILFSAVMVLSLLWGGQGLTKEITIGVMMDIGPFASAFAGFKEGMAELGYVDGKSRELNEAAIKKKIPVVSSLIMDEAIPVTFANELDVSGKQAARMAHQIIIGAKPSDLPVETSDVSLRINLRTSEKIGLKIPDDILAQAKKIIRENR